VTKTITITITIIITTTTTTTNTILQLGILITLSPFLAIFSSCTFTKAFNFRKMY